MNQLLILKFNRKFKTGRLRFLISIRIIKLFAYDIPPKTHHHLRHTVQNFQHSFPRKKFLITLQSSKPHLLMVQNLAAILPLRSLSWNDDGVAATSYRVANSSIGERERKFENARDKRCCVLQEKKKRERANKMADKNIWGWVCFCHGSCSRVRGKFPELISHKLHLGIGMTKRGRFCGGILVQVASSRLASSESGCTLTCMSVSVCLLIFLGKQSSNAICSAWSGKQRRTLYWWEE